MHVHEHLDSGNRLDTYFVEQHNIHNPFAVGVHIEL